MNESNTYIVSARKYRPATFATVVGQKNLTATLKNAISGKRLAQAYLFCGPRGVGKTSCARIFAKTINCLTPTADGEACGQCASCRAIESGSSFNLIELDAASNNSVDDIRKITEQVQVPPQQGTYKVFIIDEVHMLSNQAFNAFLKTLEEPPRYAIFILATTEKHKVIPTILSRCQIYDFKRITVNDMVDHLAYVAQSEGIEAEREALGVIALKADGAMRDALSIFDQVSASCRGHITYHDTVENLNVLDYEYYFRLIAAFVAGDVAGALLIFKEIRDKGFDPLFFVNGLAGHVRNLMVAADPRTVGLLELADDVARRYVEQAATLPLQWYYAGLKILNDTDVQYRTASNKQLLVELALIRLCQLLKPATPPFDRLDYVAPMRNPAEQTPIQASAPQPAATAAAPQPAAPRPVQSASQPAPSTPHQSTRPQPPAPPRTGTPPGIRSFRISEATRGPAVTSTQLRESPVTAEGFNQAWNDFIIANSNKHILTSAMRTARLSQSSPTEFTVVVEHPAQEQAFKSDMTPLLKYIRDKVDNDHLSLKVEIDTTRTVVKNLPPQELLRQIVSDNPAMAQFLNSIDAELV